MSTPRLNEPVDAAVAPMSSRRASGLIPRVVLILGVVLVILIPWAASPASAQGTAGPCQDATGVTVVVDFQSLGRDTIVRCASQPVASGFDALTRAGISFAAVSTVPDVVCHLQGVPVDDPCASMPAPDFYWSYWNAEAGGAWAYAQVGAADSQPVPGSVEGWSFVSDGAQSRTTEPRVAPPARPTEEDEGPQADTPALPVGDADTPAPPEPAPPAQQAPTPTSPQSGTSASGQDQPAAPAAGVDSPAAAQPDSTDDDPSQDERDAATASDNSPNGNSAADNSVADTSATNNSAAEDAAEDGTFDGEPGGDNADEEPDSPEPRPSAFDAAEPVVRPTPLDRDQVAIGDRGSISTDTDAVLAAGGSTQGVLTDDGSADGPPPTTLAGIGLILILGTSAGLVASRRRDQSP